MSEDRLKELEHLWTSDKEHYFLFEVDGDDGRRHCSIVDLRNNNALIIEDAALAAEVKRRMRAAGVMAGDLDDPELRKSRIRARLARDHEQSPRVGASRKER